MNVTTIENITPLTPQAFEVLLALAERPMYGYGIVEQCRLDSNGATSIVSRNIYSMVRRLGQWGLVKPTQQLPGISSPHPRQYYTLTDTGRMILAWECRRYREAAFLGQHRLNRFAQG